MGSLAWIRLVQISLFTARITRIDADKVAGTSADGIVGISGWGKLLLTLEKESVVAIELLL